MNNKKLIIDELKNIKLCICNYQNNMKEYEIEKNVNKCVCDIVNIKKDLNDIKKKINKINKIYKNNIN